MRNRVLLLTLVAGAVMISMNPALSQSLIYDRRAVLDGELWRLFTAPLVHFAPSHLVYDSVALMLASELIRWRGDRGFGWVCGLTPLANGLAVLAVEPQLAFYGGSSGVATAAVVLLASQGLREKGAWRCICAAALVGTAGKILFEFSTGTFAWIAVDPEPFRPVALCHLTGMLLGGVICVGQQLQAKMRGHAVVYVINKSSCENTPYGIGKGYGYNKIFQRFPRETHSSSIPLHVGSCSRRHGAWQPGVRRRA